MPNTIKSILAFLLLLLSLSSVGQIFPVQVTTQLSRPYSLYLSDYTASGSDRIAVNIFLTDISRTDLNIRLRLRIEGQGIKIETKPEFVPPLLTLHGGAPLQLISSDLADYFDPRNLNFSGISQREYEQKGALPEGFYQFCFEVYEYNRNVKISNSSCASAWLILNDPPLINLPRDGEKIRIQSPQQVIFQWTPRHTGSPNAAFTTEYDFKLVEVWPSTRNPNDAILTSPPIYETTTTSTTLIYGAAETALEPGRRYAFQIKAHSIAGTSELNLFKNNGLSQVSSFVFGDACLPPVNIIADATGPTRFTAKWDEGLSQTAYNLRYRLAQGGEWYTTNTINPDVEIKSLQPNTRYEYQVSATCGILESTFSPVASITTKSNPPIIYSCGVPLSPFDLDPTQLLDVLKVGDIIKAGDFDVTITKVTGGNGNFSGEGVIPVYYFNQAKVKAEFSGITVNKDLRMINGYLNVTGAGVDVIPSGVLNFMDQLSESLDLLDSALDKYEENLPKRFDPTVFVADKAIVIPGAIVSVMPATDGSGAVVVVDDKGNKQTIPAGTSAAITDSKGKGYLVDKQGGVHETTAAIAAKAGKREYNFAVKFARETNQAFGFDELGTKSALAATYDKLDGKYDVAWKSVAAGQTDKVQAILEGTGIDKSKVHFEQFGQALTPNTSGTNAFSLNVQGKTDGTTEGLVALYTPADTAKKEQVLGQLNVVTYNEIPKTVVIVPVNDSDGSKLKKVGDKTTLQTELNKIYGQAVTKWSVNFANNITVPGIEPFEDGGSGLLSNYTSHMRQVISAYKANMQPNTYYLFLVVNPKDPNTLGVMPRSKESGFIFVDKHADPAAIARTMAHELGHGAFNLHHTFMEPKLTQAKGTTDNLMDYPNGDKLYKYQWDKMRYPDIVMGLFEDDEEGKSYSRTGGIADSWRNSDKTVNFLTPAKQIIRLPKEVTQAYFTFGIGEYKDMPMMPAGVLKGFEKIEDGKSVVYLAEYSGDVFKGYVNNGKYADVLEQDKKIESGTAIITLPFAGGFKAYRLKGLNYSYQKSGEQANSIIDLNNTASATVKATAWQEMSVFKFSDGEVGFGISSTLINPQLTDIMDKMDANKFNEEYLTLTKIMEYRTVYPDVFAKMTVTFNSWSSIKVWSTTLFNDFINITNGADAAAMILNKEPSKITCGYFDYLCRQNNWYDKSNEELLTLFLMEFRNLITTQQRKYAPAIEIIQNSIDQAKTSSCSSAETYIVSSGITPTAIVNAAEAMSVDLLKEICPSVRARLIATVLDEFIVSDPFENAIYKLLWTCPEGNVRANFLEILAETKMKNGDYIFGVLVSAIDDRTLFMGKNFNTMVMNFLIKAYGDLIKTNSPFVVANIHPITKVDLTKISTLTKEQLENYSKSIVTYSYASFTKRLFKDVLRSVCTACTIPMSTDTKSVASFDDETNKITFTNETVSGFVTLGTSEPRTYHPLSPIILDDKAKLLDIYSKAESESGGYYVPGVMLYFLEKKADAKTTVESIQTTFDIVSLAIPGGQTTLAFKLLNFADKASAVSSLIGSASADDYPVFAKWMNVTSGVLGLANMGGGIVASKFAQIDNLETAVHLVDNTSDAITAAGHERNVIELCDKVDNINDPSKANADLIDVLNSTGNEKKATVGVLEIEKNMAKASGKTDLMNRIQKAIDKIQAYGNGVKIAKSARLQTVFETLSNKFKYLTKQTDKIFANANKDIQLAHFENGEMVIDQIGDFSKLGDNAKLQETVADAFYLEKNGAQVTEHTDDILIFEDNGVIKCFSGKNCFTSETLVQTRAGLKPIISIKVAEEVLSYDEASHAKIWSKVTKFFSKSVKKLNRLIINRDTLFATPEHKFYSKSGWLKAAALSAGMLLQTSNGFAEIKSNIAIDTTASVYNFTVEKSHTYYVGVGNILTHNDCEKLAAIIQSLGDKGQDFVNAFKSNEALLNKFVDGTYSPAIWSVLNKIDPSLAKSEDWIKKITALGAGKLDQLEQAWKLIGKDYKNLTSTLKEFSGADKIKFLDDFGGNTSILKAFDTNPGLVDAWEVLNIDDVLRKNLGDLEKLATFMNETGMEKSKLVSSFGNAKDARKWIDMKIPESDLNSLYEGIKNSPLDDLEPWTPEHKAQGWANYKSGNPDADYKTWSNQYDGNIRKASSASSGVDDYYKTLGWNCTNCKEVTTKDIAIVTEDGPQVLSRRHDIADKSSTVKKAIEVKEYSSGKVYYSEKSIKIQVALDAELLKSKEFLSIEWVFKGCEPSKPLEDALKQAGVTVTRIP